MSNYLQKKPKEKMVTESFKLPKDLKERFTDKAGKNHQVKSGILREAIEDYLNDGIEGGSS